MELYIHIPFCKKKCLYCDFNSYANCSDELILRYLTTLNREIELAGQEFGKQGKDKRITSIFIGGGTPSLIDPIYAKNLLETIENLFSVQENAEITIEANPESLTEEKLADYKAFGINRISIGCQSLFDDNLRAIGRIHDAVTAKSKINLAREFFDNLSCDIMLGLPYDTKERVAQEIEYFTQIVDHISVYQLILEENTPLEKLVKDGKIALPSDDDTIDLFAVANDVLKKHGFFRYEVSNFAKDDKYSRHNMGYWTREEYLGFGAGASSYIRREDEENVNEFRFSNFNSIDEYVDKVNAANDYFSILRAYLERLDEDSVFDEKIMLGLRTSLGVDESLIPREKLEKFKDYFVSENGRVHLNDAGFDVMNSILLELMRLN